MRIAASGASGALMRQDRVVDDRALHERHERGDRHADHRRAERENDLLAVAQAGGDDAAQPAVVLGVRGRPGGRHTVASVDAAASAGLGNGYGDLVAEPVVQHVADGDEIGHEPVAGDLVEERAELRDIGLIGPAEGGSTGVGDLELDDPAVARLALPDRVAGGHQPVRDRGERRPAYGQAFGEHGRPDAAVAQRHQHPVLRDREAGVDRFEQAVQPGQHAYGVDPVRRVSHSSIL